MIRCSAQELAQLGDLILKQGAELRFQATGTSMQPAIQDGQMIRVGPVPQGGPRRGDILFYRSGSDRAVIHRLLRKVRIKGGEWFLSGGDACVDTDAPVPADQVLGRVVAVEAANGRVVRLDRGLNLIRARLFAWSWQVAPYLRRLPGAQRVRVGGCLRSLLLPR